MKQLFDEVVNLVNQDTKDPSQLLCKLYEETGELAQVINKVTGRKIKTPAETPFKLRENIGEEIADSIQCLFALADVFEISYEELAIIMAKKNKAYENIINGRNVTIS
jgi:NTP pyrophosphatase (non-canonical NTP hydrolase)